MGLFDKVKKTTIESRRYEEKLYEVALEEVEAGEVRKGLYAKAVAKADGDKEKADGIYLKLRVQAIMDDIESKQIDQRESKEVLKVVQSIENKERIPKEPQLTDFKISKNNLNELDDAYKKSRNRLLFSMVFFYILLIGLNVFTGKAVSIEDFLETTFFVSVYIGLYVYVILIFPIRYFKRKSNPKYLRVARYRKAIKKYRKAIKKYRKSQEIK